MFDIFDKLQKVNSDEALDRIKGSLVGGAVGDALGYRVEFMQDFSIFKRYGDQGITEYELTDGVAQISDDTQMTLFTAEGLLHAKDRWAAPTVDQYTEEIYKSYLDWYQTQSFDSPVALGDSRREHSELLNVAGLFSPRAPGGTCLSALESGNCGNLDYRINHSKGCGGVMRVAPIPLMLAGKEGVSPETVDMIAARSSAITHGHLLGFVSSVLISRIIAEIMGGKSLHASVEIARRAVRAFGDAGDADLLDYFERKIADAVELAADHETDPLDAIRTLGEGWVAEETAAIAVYCSLRFSDDFEQAIIASVNHSGDSDSTGAVTGNIVGAYLGYAQIPERFITTLEHRDLILSMAERLAE